MKKRALLLGLVAGLFLTIGSANASLVEYEIGEDSSVTLSNNTSSWFLGSAEISGNLVAGLEDVAGSLNDNETATIDFFTLTVDANGILAGGIYKISATLDLDTPDVSASGTGGGLFGSIAGEINGGTLSWNDYTLPDVFVLSDGNEISIDFESGIALGLGDTVTVHAYITNNGGAAPVPEPSTVLLFGAGLAGLIGYNRKRTTRK